MPSSKGRIFIRDLCEDRLSLDWNGIVATVRRFHESSSADCFSLSKLLVGGMLTSSSESRSSSVPNPCSSSLRTETESFFLVNLASLLIDRVGSIICVWMVEKSEVLSSSSRPVGLREPKVVSETHVLGLTGELVPRSEVSRKSDLSSSELSTVFSEGGIRRLEGEEGAAGCSI
jgi:hypothetical protein